MTLEDRLLQLKFCWWPSNTGLSGTDIRNLSSLDLKFSMEPVHSLTSFGTELKSLGPETANDPSLMVCIRQLTFRSEGMRQRSPRRPEITVRIELSSSSKFGERPLIILHTYITVKRSRLLSRENNPSFFSLSW